MKPLVKWAGGKTQLLKVLMPLIPKYKRYYEPFIGGGALFFMEEPEEAVINDSNKQLMNVYIQCRDNPSEFKKKLKELQQSHIDSPEYFNGKREEYNHFLEKDVCNLESAALLVYLNKTGFNGLYRLNSKGLFNTPYGYKKRVSLYDRENIDGVSSLLKTTTILMGDFEEACRNCKKDDFVFFDSPYYKTFDTYQAGGFSEDDHLRLARLFKRLSDKSVKCLLTNSNETFIKDLYKDYDIKVVDVKRMINCDGQNRVGKEVIIKNY